MTVWVYFPPKLINALARMGFSDLYVLDKQIIAVNDARTVLFNCKTNSHIIEPNSNPKVFDLNELYTSIKPFSLTSKTYIDFKLSQIYDKRRDILIDLSSKKLFKAGTESYLTVLNRTIDIYESIKGSLSYWVIVNNILSFSHLLKDSYVKPTNVIYEVEVLVESSEMVLKLDGVMLKRELEKIHQVKQSNILKHILINGKYLKYTTIFPGTYRVSLAESGIKVMYLSPKEISEKEGITIEFIIAGLK